MGRNSTCPTQTGLAVLKVFPSVLSWPLALHLSLEDELENQRGQYRSLFSELKRRIKDGRIWLYVSTHQHSIKLLPALSYTRSLPWSCKNLGAQWLTCEFLFASVPNTCFQIFQLDLNFLVIPQGLFALPPAIRSRIVPRSPRWGIVLANCCVAAKDSRTIAAEVISAEHLLHRIPNCSVNHTSLGAPIRCGLWMNQCRLWPAGATCLTHPTTSGAQNLAQREKWGPV